MSVSFCCFGTSVLNRAPRASAAGFAMLAARTEFSWLRWDDPGRPEAAMGVRDPELSASPLVGRGAVNMVLANPRAVQLPFTGGSRAIVALGLVAVA